MDNLLKRVLPQLRNWLTLRLSISDSEAKVSKFLLNIILDSMKSSTEFLNIASRIFNWKLVWRTAKDNKWWWSLRKSKIGIHCWFLFLNLMVTQVIVLIPLYGLNLNLRILIKQKNEKMYRKICIGFCT